jgi:valyl-tRNA synthetase
VGETDPEGDGWERENDVLDTWFSSALWPFATMGWPEETRQLKSYYPTNVLSTARDIIFLWVARMIMMGLEFKGEVPFEDVYIHSVIQAPDGRRMSKSLGTGIDPLEEIDSYGADAVRFGLLAMSSAQDVRYSVEKVKQGNDLANKLWNASRLILMKVDDVPAQPVVERAEDAWILSRLQRVIASTTELIDGYDFSHAVLGVYDFFYSEVCDWYLEFSKGRLYDADADKTAVSGNLLFILEKTLALMHPLMPFVTEEIWALLPGEHDELLATAAFPVADPEFFDEAAEAQFNKLIEAIVALRRFRDEMNVKPSEQLLVRFSDEYADLVTSVLPRVARVTASLDGAEPAAATITLESGSLEILANDAFDPTKIEAEIGAKNEARVKELDGEIARIEGKLSNEQFVSKAPDAVVQVEREKLARYQEERAALA